MDVNGTRFHHLLGRDDWLRCQGEDGVPLSSPPAAPSFAWNDRQELTLQPEVFLFTQEKPAQSPPDVDLQRRGVAADRFNNIYWIAESGTEIRVQSPGSTPAHFWSAADIGRCLSAPAGGFAPLAEIPPPAPQSLAGLTVTVDHYLLVGTLAPAGVMVFDLYDNGPSRLWVPLPAGFVPFDMAARPRGGAWILDRRNRRVAALDRLLGLVPRTPLAAVPAQFEDACPSSGGKSPAAPVAPSSPILQLDDANVLAIEALPDDSFLVLAQPALALPPEATFATLSRYRFASGLASRVSTACLREHLPPGSPFVLKAYDFALTSSPSDISAFVITIAADDGNQCFAFDLQCGAGDGMTLRARAQFQPMRLFGGKGLVTVNADTCYDFGSGWIPLCEQSRPRYPQQAALIAGPFDGREPQCHWHRLLLDAVLPPTCGLEVWSRAADDREELVSGPGPEWTREATPYLRGNGTEVPYAQPATRTHEGTWELLLGGLRGRWAQIKLVVVSDQRSTPRLRALRLYYPRFSYLANYLPAAYRLDAASADFLDRFLANFEGTLTSIEDRIAAAQVLFDPSSTPGEFLPWLAQWLGVVLDPSWDDSKRRLFLRRATTFFQWRGTATGLRMVLRLALDASADETLFDQIGGDERRFGIRVVESFTKRRLGGRWLPADGQAELSRRYRTALGLPGTITAYPLVWPEPAHEAEWRAFSWQMLGFVPAAQEELTRWRWFLCNRYLDGQAMPAAYAAWPSPSLVPMPTDLPPGGPRRDDWRDFQTYALSAPRSLIAQWHAFLAHRHLTIDALNAAYGTAWRGFDEVAYPTILPDSDAALADWFDFEGKALAMQRGAHRFQVLLPLFPQDNDDAQRETRRALAQRIVDIEKPAHTVFDVQYYWAMFLVGTARVGYDTQLDVGSRAPQLVTRAILNRMHLGGGYLDTNFPPAGTRRVIAVGALQQGARTGRNPS